MHYEDDAEKSHAEPSAKDQLEGRLGEIDKLVMMLAMMKTLLAPSPSPTPAGMPPPPSSGPGVGPMPMGSVPPPMGGPPPMPMGGQMGGPPMGGGMPPGMGMGMMPQTQLQQALMAGRGLV